MHVMNQALVHTLSHTYTHTHFHLVCRLLTQEEAAPKREGERGGGGDGASLSGLRREVAPRSLKTVTVAAVVP